MKIVLGIVGAVVLVLVGAAAGFVLADEDDEAAEGSAPLPAGWALCSNPARGFAIGYPARWHTDAIAEEERCEFFDPRPFEVPRESDFTGAALEIDPGGETYETVVTGLVNRRFARVLARKETRLAAGRAVRIETEATGESFEGEGTKVTSWVVDRDGTAFVARTTGAIDQGFEYGRHQRTLDQAIQTLRFFTATATPLADGRVLPGQSDLPRAVEKKRIAIAKAAAARDYEALDRLLPRTGGFEYTFGGAVEGGPTAYWRRLEATTDEAPLDSLVAVLSLPYTKVRGIYVWPFAFDRDPKRLSEDELELLSSLATPQEIAGWRDFGGYIGWRAGIEPDGDWVFFIAGD